MTASYRGRFAPSPTGPLHFGSLLAAVASWLDARAQGGEWLVRIEDVDTTRTVPGATDEILRVLEACALEWDGEIVRQSERTARYAEALEVLDEKGVVYRCRCSRKEIADSALRGLEGPVYPGTCRALALDRSVAGADRVRVADERIVFEDRVQGTIAQEMGRDIGDFVLRRRDGLFSYQLAVVVDDADQGITDVVRGADLLLSTPRQILLQRLLGFTTPRYLHVPVATNAQGQKLSKQTRAAPVTADRACEALQAALAALGQPAPESAEPRALLAGATLAWNAARIPRKGDFIVTGSNVEPQGGGV
jgi:glutamyl-Q tRNA(Asp) synthetase